MQKFSLAFLTFSLLVLSACSSNKEFDRSITSEQEVFQKAVDRINGKQWDAAIQTLQLLEEHFPFGAYAEQAQLELIYAHYKGGNFEAAIAAAERFIRLNPQHGNVDYAYYMLGVASFSKETSFRTVFISDTSNRDAGSAKESFEHFTELLNRFPNSQYGPDASKRMEFLRNILARYEIHVANYYFRRGAFLAAANRGKFVVENMQRTPAVPDGLAVMAQAYHLAGLQHLADDSVKVLKMNFPDYPALNESGEFQYEYKVDPDRSLVSWMTLGLFDKKQYVSFDTRELYNPFYNGKPGAPPSPPNL